MINQQNYSQLQKWVLIVCRMLVGWHFFYEGWIKLTNPEWSARGFLLDSKGWMADVFYWMANNEGLLKVVDLINIWTLVLVGAALILGLFARWAALAGGVLLVIYYLSHPPFIGVEYLLPSEGSYLFINKNLIEASLLGVLYLFPTSQLIGLDYLINKTVGK
jgi:thiosulfate dehydrogenase [quinone] large subunit